MSQAGEKTCHSEPVTDVTGVGIRSPVFRPNSFAVRNIFADFHQNPDPEIVQNAYFGSFLFRQAMVY